MSILSVPGLEIERHVGSVGVHRGKALARIPSGARQALRSRVSGFSPSRTYLDQARRRDGGSFIQYSNFGTVPEHCLQLNWNVNGTRSHVQLHYDIYCVSAAKSPISRKSRESVLGRHLRLGMRFHGTCIR